MKKWFVVYTKPRHELKVAEQFSAMGITNYCPTVKLIKQYSDRKKKIIKPLLPSYVMVNIEEKKRNDVFSLSGVLRYLFFLGKPAQIKDKEIALMRNHLNGVYDQFSLNTLKNGQAYKIPYGPFAGSSGKVIETSKSKVKLELQSLGMTITLKREAA
jgi:transcription antitermination factor NusG